MLCLVSTSIKCLISRLGRHLLKFLIPHRGTWGVGESFGLALSITESGRSAGHDWWTFYMREHLYASFVVIAKVVKEILVPQTIRGLSITRTTQAKQVGLTHL